MPKTNSEEVGGTGFRAKHRKLVWCVASVSFRRLIRVKHYPKGFTGVQRILLHTISTLEQMRSMQLLS